MNKESLIKFSVTKKVKDYSYAILFFLIFSFFVLAVIKPNLTTVFNLQKERESLLSINNVYNGIISKIVNIQASLEDTRNDTYVLDEALPKMPQINKLIEDINKTATISGIILNKLNINEINLKGITKNEKKNQLIIDFETSSEFEKIKAFINEISKQRRLKTIDTLSIDKEDKLSSISSNLRIKIRLEAFYL